MSSPITTIRNIGPAFEAACRRAGITSAEEIRTLGADQTYSRLLEAGTRPHFIGYYVLVMGLQGRPWNDCQGTEKAELRKRFDRLKAEINAPAPSHASKLAAELDAIGIRVTAKDLTP